MKTMEVRHIPDIYGRCLQFYWFGYKHFWWNIIWSNHPYYPEFGRQALRVKWEGTGEFCPTSMNVVEMCVDCTAVCMVEVFFFSNEVVFVTYHKVLVVVRWFTWRRNTKWIISHNLPFRWMIFIAYMVNCGHRQFEHWFINSWGNFK